MAILHLVRCDACGEDTPMDMSHTVNTQTVVQGPNGATWPQSDRMLSVPSTIKQIDGRHFCSWACVANYAETQQGTAR